MTPFRASPGTSNWEDSMADPDPAGEFRYANWLWNAWRSPGWLLVLTGMRSI